MSGKETVIGVDIMSAQERNMFDDNVRSTAAHCRHYAMCKIDYLDTGLCPAGAARQYVAYFPQGRMDIVDALAKGRLTVTEGLLDIADSCDLCGRCDIQCHFYSSLRPLPVMAALKAAVAEHRARGETALPPAFDSLLEQIRAIVGSPWATNDPAILAAYSHDPFPLTTPRVPRAVVLPGSADEVEAIVRLAAREAIPFVVRGNGASVYGQVFSEGLVLDVARMKEMQFDPANWSVTVGPGVSAFDLQREARRRGFRVNVAEPAATVVGNVLCSGLFSTWGAAYGMGADHVLDMEMVDRNGHRSRLSDGASGTAHLSYRHEGREVPGVCTRAQVRLYPVTGDEQGVLVPFGELEPAVRFARELSVRRIGTAVAVLGSHFMASFMAVSLELATAAKRAFEEDLGMPYAVFVVADPYGRDAVRRMATTVIDQDLYRLLALGLPRLTDRSTLDVVRAAEGHRPPYELLASPEMRPILAAALESCADTLASAVDPDLRAAYANLYRRPELTDLVWLNEFRIVSARMARHKHVVVFLVFIPLDPELVTSLCERLDRTARDVGLDHAYGFLTPIDLGRRAVLEYDYYIDHPDPLEKQRMSRAMAELVPWLDALCQGPSSNMTWLKTVLMQGSARKESWLYRDLSARGSC